MFGHFLTLVMKGLTGMAGSLIHHKNNYFCNTPLCPIHIGNPIYYRLKFSVSVFYSKQLFLITSQNRYENIRARVSDPSMVKLQKTCKLTKKLLWDCCIPEMFHKNVFREYHRVTVSTILTNNNLLILI